jgi:hypothetical protein
MSSFKKLAVALLASAVFAATPMAMSAQAAQNAPIDLDELDASLWSITGESLAARLQQAPPQVLPAGFTNAQYVDPLIDPTTLSQRGLIPLEGIEGIDRTVAYAIDGNPTVANGSAANTNTNTLTYAIFLPSEILDDDLAPDEDDEADNALGDTMDQIEDGIEEQFAADVNPNVGLRLTGVERIDDDVTTFDQELNGLIATYTLSQGSTNAAAQLYVVQIGMVFIFGLVTIGHDGQVTEAELADLTAVFAEDLTVAGIDHLATTVEYIETQP